MRFELSGFMVSDIGLNLVYGILAKHESVRGHVDALEKFLKVLTECSDIKYTPKGWIVQPSETRLRQWLENAKR